METRTFIILHDRGALCVKALSATKALQHGYVPGGYRAVLGVIDAAFVTGTHNARELHRGSPFLAFIGQPAGRVTKP